MATEMILLLATERATNELTVAISMSVLMSCRGALPL